MFINKFPYFKRGKILKKSMLENLRDYPREMFDILCKEYTDGVIEGCDLTVQEDQLVVHKGIVKYNNELYILEEETSLTYQKENRELVLKIKFNQERQEEYNLKKGQPYLSKDREMQYNEIELGRFKLRKGARLRAEYNKFNDFDTEYNTLNLIHSKYAGIKSSTMHPKILEMFASKVYKGDTENVFDITFCSEVLNTGCNSGRLIDNYLRKRLGLKDNKLSNGERFKYMKRIIQKVQKKDKPKKSQKPQNRQKIIID